MNTLEGVAAVLAAGGVGWFGNAVVQWMRSRETRHATDRTVDQKVEEHRDQLTLDLLEAARTEAAAWREEVSNLRPMVTDMLVRLAHFEEALDHLHALLASEEPAERSAAERRARAFLKRMRRDPLSPELRNPVQSAASRESLIDRATGQDTET